MRLTVQQSIINKAFRENKSPFERDVDVFRWSGMTKVRSQNTGKTYEVEITLSLKTNPRLADQVAMCLLKSDGIRMEDLLIVGMIDPKLDGSIEMKGLPKDKMETNLGKLIKMLNKPSDSRM